MKTDGIFSTHKFEILFKNYGEPINLFLVGDIHWNSSNCDKEKFKNWCEMAKKVKNSYFLLMGDYIDSMSTSERKAYKTIEFHDQTSELISQAIRKDVDELSDIMSFMKGKVIGVIGGNHTFEFDSGITADMIIADRLKAKYLGVNGFIKLVFNYAKKGTKKGGRHAYDIVAHHGLGGGRTCGASMNKLQQMANNYSADMIAMGHDHNRAVDYINRLELNQHMHFNNRRIALVRTGSFLKSYVDGKASYVVDAGLPPSDLGAVRFLLTPMREHQTHKGKRVDKRWVEPKAML